MANCFAGVFVFPTLDEFSSGTPDMLIQAFGDPHVRYATNPIASRLQDQWRPAAGVTVIGGVRYEAQMLPAPFGAVTHNVAPRLGIARQPERPWKVGTSRRRRLVLDRFPLAFLNDALQKDGVHGFEQYAEGAEAARILRYPRVERFQAPYHESRHRSIARRRRSHRIPRMPGSSQPVWSGHWMPIRR